VSRPSIDIFIEDEAKERIAGLVGDRLGVIQIPPNDTVTDEERIEATKTLVATTIDETIKATATEIVAQLIEAGVSAHVHLRGDT
jgi:hypothetical protein